jgi:polysaccharide export outer membrane protein
MRAAVLLLFLLLLAAAPAFAQVPPYTLGPDDQLFINVLDLDELSAKDDKPVRVDLRGNITLPLIGRIHAAGLTVEQLEAELRSRLKAFLQSPEVSVTIADFRSQPVSVLGAVKNPGVHQIHGRKTLFEVLSLAGGLNPDAGNNINITRRKSAGPLPLPNAQPDSTGEFLTAAIDVKAIMDAKNPEQNIPVLPDDVISVPKASLVYVIGAVRKPGGFILSEKEKISVLQALSLAEGLDRIAKAKGAKILRPQPNSENRAEIAVNVADILAGKSADVSLRAEDILFIPTNVPKSAALRGLEAALQVGTGIAIYRR